MVELTLTADLRAVDQLENDVQRFIDRATPVLRKGAESDLRTEAPKKRGRYALTITGEIVAPGTIEVGTNRFPGLPARPAIAINSRGVTKQISLSPTQPVDLTSILLDGRGPIFPRNKQAIIIGVDSPPSEGGYIVSDDQTYIVRRSAGRAKGNRFDIRADRRFRAGLDALLLTVPLD